MQKTMQVTIHLNPETDADIIAFIEECWENRSAAAKTIIREYMEQYGYPVKTDRYNYQIEEV